MTIGVATLGTGVNDGTATSVTIPITPPATGTYTTIEVRYRIVGASAWSDGGNYTGTPEVEGNHQITGLTGPNTYEVITFAVLSGANGEPSVSIRVKCSLNTSPVNERIIDDIIADLKTITTGNGYHQTVYKAIRFAKPEDKASHCPMVDVVIGNENNMDEEIDGSYGLTTRDMSVSLRLYVKDTDDPDQALSYLGADVDKALNADVHRGALAQDTTINSIMRVYVDADGGEITGMMDMTVTVRYQQHLEDPYESR